MAKALNYSINEQNIVFTSKDLTIDENVFAYKDIVRIQHNSSKKFFRFQHANEWHDLYYDDVHAKGVITIFSRIQNLHKQRLDAEAKKNQASEPIVSNVAAGEAANAEAKPVATANEAATAEPKPVTTANEAATAEPKPVTTANEAATAEPKPVTTANEAATAEAKPVTTANEAANAEAQEGVVKQAEEALVSKQNEEKTPKEETTETDSEKKNNIDESDIKEALLEEKPIKFETDNSENTEETKKTEGDPEAKAVRKKRMRRGVLTMIIVVVVIVLAAVAFYSFFGTSENLPFTNDQETTHQYDDIDELVEEMQ